jgi:hypothetical protein
MGDKPCEVYLEVKLRTAKKRPLDAPATWDVIEGAVISNYILALGHAMGRQLLPFEPIAVELTQQTPLDPLLGDLVIANAKLVRLIEFKRELNRSPKEQAKLVILKRLLLVDIDSRLESISRKNHWYVQTNFNKWQSSVIVPYLDQESPVGDRDLARFVKETADALAGPAMTEQEFADWQWYMQKVTEFFGSRRRIPRTRGGLLFTVNAQGDPAFFAFRDTIELAMTPRLVIDNRMALEVEKQELSPKMERDQELSHDLRGPRMRW